MRIKMRWLMFLWHVRNRRHWNRGEVKVWFDWFTIDHDDWLYQLRFRTRKYKRWYKAFLDANRIVE